ncbi:MAG: phosphoribosylanthranilate isomerase [Cyclobacteriaceae bacterium]
MRDADNIKGMISLAPDYIGFIFYPKSKRYVGDNFIMPQIPKPIKKVGVFVNEAIESLLQKVLKYELDYVQLHGDESVEYVEQVKKNEVNVFKVFSLSDQMPIQRMKKYESFVDCFLFDTKTPEYGGSGRKFKWSILKQYNLNKPFLLSGGIALEDVEIIKDLQLENLIGIDVNSKFEASPGFKNLELVKELKAKI